MRTMWITRKNVRGLYGRNRTNKEKTDSDKREMPMEHLLFFRVRADAGRHAAKAQDAAA